MLNPLIIALFGGLGPMLGWGISDFFAKKSVDKVGDTVSLFWMQLIGIIPIFLLFIINPVFPEDRNFLLIVPYALIDVAGYLLFYASLRKGKVSIVSPMVASYAVFAVLVSAFIFGENLSPLIGFIIALVIIGIILTSIDLKQLKSDTINKKDLMKGVPEAILAVVCFSFWFPFWDNYVSVSGWLPLLLGARICMVLFIMLFSSAKHISLKINDNQVFGWLILIGMLDAGAYLTLTWGYSNSTYTSIVSSLSAAFSLPTLIMARIFLKEKLQPLQWLGVSVIVGGMVAMVLI